MLTSKQAKLLDFLTNTLKNNKVSPSFDEMREFLGLNSKSGVHRLISSLEESIILKITLNMLIFSIIKIAH